MSDMVERQTSPVELLTVAMTEDLYFGECDTLRTL